MKQTNDWFQAYLNSRYTPWGGGGSIHWIRATWLACVLMAWIVLLLRKDN